MKRLTQKLFEEAQKMERVWINTNPEGDIEWYRREIASFLGIDFHTLSKKLSAKKKKRKR